MIKKTICFWVILIICLGLFGGCNQETDIGATLIKYKIEKKTTIEIYAQQRQNNYSEENWAIICGIVADGKATIDAAESMDDVETAVNETKTAINVVSQKEEGEMYEWTRIEGIECCPEIVLTDAYDSNYSKSKIAYEDAITYFIEGNKYTDDFGGVFIDNNGIYNICVVGNREPIKSDYLLYRQVDNSFNFLESIVVEISEITHEFTIWMAGTSVTRNKVIIYLKDENKLPLLIEYLETKNLYQEGTLEILIEDNGINPN